jgi:Tol biopolymer transport system component
MRALVTLASMALLSCGPRTRSAPPETPPPVVAKPLRDPRETHLGSIKQLTRGGENAEAYWSSDGKQLIFQSTRPPHGCDQIFKMTVDAADPTPTLLSSGKGRTTCSYFFPGDRSILYSSTHLGGDDCPPVPDHSQGYVWPLYQAYDVFGARADGSELRRLTDADAYDAEATVCPVDGSIVFTSTRDGDLELYRMDPDGKNVVRLTRTPGYDGGAFFSQDCKQIVWRASRPAPGPELDDYQRLLDQGLVRPTKLELWVANADGTEARQVTYLESAAFAPYFFPSGDRIIFSTNYGDPKGREFDIWAIDTDGTNLERITYTPGFDGFPMFSPDGARLAFSSNRNQAAEGDTDVYVAEWIDAPPAAGVEPADRFLAHVAWLADDAREGRGVGTRGLDEAADWLAERFRAAGLEPAGDAGGYKHAFEIPVSVKLGADTTMEIDGFPLAPVSFTPLGFSANGEVSGDVVFAGYGITAPELEIDDYKGVKAKGKIVIVRRFVPEDERFDDKLERQYGDPRFKAWNAREHGAKALIIVDAPPPAKGAKGAAAKEPPKEAPLPKLRLDPNGDAGIPVVVVERAHGAALTHKGKHKVRIRVSLEEERKPVHNVVGRIRAGAPSPLPGAVLVGAHYDHLGLDGPGSLWLGAPAPHNGADDNASGTAGLLIVAEDLARRRAELARDVYVVAFTAEELGILGSSQFTRKPPAGMSVGDLVAMLNMDMIGRLRGNTVTVRGTESAAEWDDAVKGACAARRIQCSIGGDGYGPSDHTPFYAAGIPVLHFFTGAHREYHTPNDDPALINAAGGVQVARLVGDLTVETAATPTRLSYRAVPAPPPVGDVRARGGSLGTVPEYSELPEGKTGVLLAGVRPGGPADQAGLTRGDLIVKIGDHEVHNIEDMMFALRKGSPGDKVRIVFERDGKTLSADAVLGAPSRR